MYGFFNFLGHYFKINSFYLIYIAIIETGFEAPYSLLFRELKQSEEAFKQKTIFLEDDQGRIYNTLGIKIADSGSIQELEEERIKRNGYGPQKDYSLRKDYNSLVHNIKGLIGFRINSDLEPLSIDGEFEEITGYNKEDFLSGEVK